jgi:colanic acid biosynthesis glycosyl transferase WcaI
MAAVTPSGSSPTSFLILTQYYPPEVGAPQIRLHTLARHLVQRGFGVTVVTALPNYPTGAIFPGYRGALVRHEKLDGVPVVRTWLWAAGGRGAARLLSYLSFCLTSFFACLFATRPDWILVESPPLFLAFTAYLVSRLRGVPYVFIVSDLWPASVVALGAVTNPRMIAVARWLEHFLYRKANLVVALTEGIRAAIEGLGRVALVPNGVDSEAFRRVPPAALHWIARGEVAFIFAGTHGYAQGLDVILDAAEILTDRPEIVFLLIGDGPERARLVAAAQQRRLESVRFVPTQPPAAMPGFFSAARASLVTLRDDPLFEGARPSKILPSLACETPVIFSGAGEAAALIREGRCGIVVPPEDPKALAAAVRTMADDPEGAAKLGKRGRRLVVRDFSWGPIIDRELLTNLLP